jgi:hypothetical protein
MLKSVSSVANAIGALNYVGTWNASTNSPALADGVGTKGDYYVVSVAGSTNLDGITIWGVGDWAVFNGAAWQKLDGGSTGDFIDMSYTGTLTGGTGVINIGGGQVYKDAAGNLGINVIPKSWRVNESAIEFGRTPTSSSLSNFSTIGTLLSNNVYLNTSGQYSRKDTGTISMYQTNSGLHEWYSDTSGVAGPFTPTAIMSLSLGGALATTTGSLGTISERRFKTDIKPATSQIEDLKVLAGLMKTYKKIAFPDKKQLGWIIDEVEDAFPALIDTKDVIDTSGNVIDTVKIFNLGVVPIKAVGALGEVIGIVEDQQVLISSLIKRIEALES